MFTHVYRQQNEPYSAERSYNLIYPALAGVVRHTFDHSFFEFFCFRMKVCVFISRR